MFPCPNSTRPPANLPRKGGGSAAIRDYRSYGHHPAMLPSVTGRMQEEITRGNVTIGNVAPMDEFDAGWQDFKGPWQRLRWARARWQRKAGSVNGSADHAAQSLGMKPGTYRAYERDPASSKSTALDHQSAIRFARKFQVSWQWLLTGAGTPFDESMPEQVERVVTAVTRMPEDMQKAFADMAEAFLQRKG